MVIAMTCPSTRDLNCAPPSPSAVQAKLPFTTTATTVDSSHHSTLSSSTGATESAPSSQAMGNSSSPSSTLMIALYYCYTPHSIPDPSQHADYHTQLCEEYKLNGRIRVSEEGLNGVLSGFYVDLQDYEDKVHEELMRIMKQEHQNKKSDKDDREKDEELEFELDVKYCKLRADIPQEQQLFQKLSVKVTKEVVSLEKMQHLEISKETSSRGGYGKGRRRRRKQRRNHANHQNQEQDQNDEKHEEKHKTVLVDSEEKAQKSEEKSFPDQQENPINTDTNNKTNKEELCPHLTPQQWHESLLSSSSKNNAVILDARNSYESRVGYFAVPPQASENSSTNSSIPTILTNTRKHASLPQVFHNNQQLQRAIEGKDVYMYCTGGVRCEVASQYLHEMYNKKGEENGKGPRKIYQLKGGIQRYLEVYGTDTTRAYPPSEEEEKGSMSAQATPAADAASDSVPPTCLFQGKNFVFDPRRTDPVIGIPKSEPSFTANSKSSNNETKNYIVGRCLVCEAPHDDYDNGHAPSEDREARCCRCRVLILVCNYCRLHRVRCWGENDEEKNAEKKEVFCGDRGKECVDDGNGLHVHIIGGSHLPAAKVVYRVE